MLDLIQNPIVVPKDLEEIYFWALELWNVIHDLVIDENVSW